MKLNINIIKKLKRLRGRFRRLVRILFPSPAEVRLIELMGGKVLTFDWLIARKTGFPLAIVLKMGRALKHENIRREVQVGPYYVDFGNDIGRAIEVDGREYHTDVVAAFDRDSYLYQRGWRVMHIPAAALWREPDKSVRKVLEFLNE